MELHWTGYLQPGVSTISVILPRFNLLHLPNQHGHRPLLHQEARTHCLQPTDCLVFTRLGCSCVNGGNGTNLPIEGCTRSQVMRVSAGAGNPSKVSVTFPAKRILEWAAQEDSFIPKLMPLVMGDRLQHSACTTRPKRSCGNVAAGQSSPRGTRRWMAAAQPGARPVSFAPSAGSEHRPRGRLSQGKDISRSLCPCSAGAGTEGCPTPPLAVCSRLGDLQQPELLGLSAFLALSREGQSRHTHGHPSTGA